MSATSEDVFISYAGEDREYAKSLCDELQTRGIQAFIYERTGSLELGKDWKAQLDQKLEKAAAVLLLASEHSANSEFVMLELMQCRKLGKADAVIPVFLAPEESLDGLLAAYTRQQGVKAYTQSLQAVADEIARDVDRRKGTRSATLSLMEQDGPLIGRNKEIQNVVDDMARLKSQGVDGRSRFVVISGGPGMGKTSFGEALARALYEQESRDTYSIQLLERNSLFGLADAISSKLGLGVNSSEPDERKFFDQMVRKLSDRGPTVIVLDNIETLEASVQTAISDLVMKSPSLTCIVTVRGDPPSLRPDPLTHRVGPLRTPDPGKIDQLSAEELQAFESVQLFDRWHRCRSLEELKIAAQLCAQVDGMPAAIKALARSTRQLPDLLANIQHWLQSKKNPLWSTYEFCLNSLEPEAQLFFLQLASFRGGFTYEAAAKVYQGVGMDGVASADADTAYDVFDRLTTCGLVDSYNRHYAGENQGRYIVYWPLRQLAAGKWEKEVAPEVREKHDRDFVAYFLELARDLNEKVHRKEAGNALSELGLEADNLLRIYEVALQRGDYATATQTVVELNQYFCIRGPVQVLVERAERLLQLVDATEVESRALLNSCLASLRWEIGDWDGAVQVSERAVEGIDAIQAPVQKVAAMLQHAKLISDRECRKSDGDVWIERARETAKVDCPRWMHDTAQFRWASSLEGTKRWREGLDRFRSYAADVVDSGDLERALQARNSLALVLYRAGRPSEALEHLSNCVELNLIVQDAKWHGGLLTNRGTVLGEMDLFEEAFLSFEKAVTSHLAAGALSGWNAVNTVSWARAECIAGKHEAALERFQANRSSILAFEYCWNHLWMHIWNGIALLHCQREKEALEELKTAERLYRRHGSTNTLRFMAMAAHLAKAHLLAGSEKEALPLLREAVAVADDFRLEEECETRHFRETGAMARSLLAELS